LGSEEESWMYWSLKTRKALGSGEASKTTSFEDLRTTEKPNGVVLESARMRSEDGWERRKWVWGCRDDFV